MYPINFAIVLLKGNHYVGSIIIFLGISWLKSWKNIHGKFLVEEKLSDSHELLNSLNCLFSEKVILTRLRGRSTLEFNGIPLKFIKIKWNSWAIYYKGDGIQEWLTWKYYGIKGRWNSMTIEFRDDWVHGRWNSETFYFKKRWNSVTIVWKNDGI